MEIKKTRKGKHKEGKSSIGLYVDDDTRALLALTVDQSAMTATDILIAGIHAKAAECGIMKDGRVADNFIPAIELIKHMILEERAKRKRRAAK